MCIEPISPDKRAGNKFRESSTNPKTLSYKVKNILTAGQDEPPELSAETFKKNKKKRKINVYEPVNTLPLPIWTSSGKFIEEIEVTHSTSATKFIVSTQNRSKVKKSKTSQPSINDTALSFKQSCLFSKDIKRETSRDVLHRKMRKEMHQKF